MADHPGAPWQRLGIDGTRARLLQYLSERSHWLVLLIPPLHGVAHDLAEWLDAHGYALARVDVFLIDLAEVAANGVRVDYGLVTIAAIPAEDVAREALTRALQACAVLGEEWAEVAKAARPGIFLAPVPSRFAAGALRVMALFEHYLSGDGDWRDEPPSMPRGRIGYG